MNKRIETVTELDLKRLTAILVNCPGDQASFDLLDEKLARAKVIDPATAAPTLITMNSVFRGVAVANDQPLHLLVDQLRLAYPQMANSSGGHISIFSPLGVEILGSNVGDTIAWRGHDGRLRRMKIDEIFYQPEANGDWHL